MTLHTIPRRRLSCGPAAMPVVKTRKGDAMPSPSAPFTAIVVMSLLLSAAWLLTGSLWLTVIIMLLGLLNMAPAFPDLEAAVRDDALLRGLQRWSLPLALLITALAAAARSLV